MAEEMERRPLEELLAREDIWPELDELIESAINQAEVLEVDEANRGLELHQLQVTVGSYLGSLTWHTGGFTVEQGWLRVLGGANEAGLPSILDATAGTGRGLDGPPPSVTVGFDVLGGEFAINGGRFEGKLGNVFYFAPDSLEWEDCGMGHAAWVNWVLHGDLHGFYESYWWPNWEAEVSALKLDETISFVPFLSTQEAQDDIAATSRATVAWQETRLLLGASA